jgi:hypothetical protein
LGIVKSFVDVLFKDADGLEELLFTRAFTVALKNITFHAIGVSEKCFGRPSWCSVPSGPVSAVASASAFAGSSTLSPSCCGGSKNSPWWRTASERTAVFDWVVWGGHSCREMFFGVCRFFCPDAVVTVILFFPIFVIVPLFA